MNQQTVSPSAWAAMFLLGTIWGGSYLAIRLALNEVPVLTVVAFRVGGAALALWAVVLLRGLPMPRTRRAWIGVAGMGLMNNVIPFTLITWGQQYSASGLAAILNAGTALFGVVIAALVFADERMTARKGLGVTLGFLGVATAIGLENLTTLDLSSLAQWALIGAAFSYGLSGSWGRAFLKGLPPITAAAGMLTVSSAIMVPAALIRDGVPSFNYGLQTFAALGYLSLIASAAAYLIFYKVMAVAGAGNASLVTLLVAPVGILLGVVVLGEELQPQAYAGFALLALGLLVLDGRLFRRRPPPAVPPAPPV